MDAETPARSSIPGIPRCCCGKDDCAFLRYNGTLLEGLERDVQTAAQLGQVCTGCSFVLSFLLYGNYMYSNYCRAR